MLRSEHVFRVAERECDAIEIATGRTCKHLGDEHHAPNEGLLRTVTGLSGVSDCATECDGEQGCTHFTFWTSGGVCDLCDYFHDNSCTGCKTYLYQCGDTNSDYIRLEAGEVCQAGDDLTTLAA